MLSEGWDAKTVTHIMGLRAFTSQLLCEQVVGRGLRRTAYEVNQRRGCWIRNTSTFLVCLSRSFRTRAGKGATAAPVPKTEVRPLSEHVRYEIAWPNVVRIDYDTGPS